MKEIILILDFGSQYTHLIKTCLLNIGIYSEIFPADISLCEFKDKYGEYLPKGIILSGGAHSVNDNFIPFDDNWLNGGVPILGICYGHQLISKTFGGVVSHADAEYGKQKIRIDACSLIFKGVKKSSTVWFSHSDTVTVVPKGFKPIASSPKNNNAAIENADLKIYGLQFHPEVSHTEEGLKILSNFAISICGVAPTEKWGPKLFLSELADRYKKIVGSEKIICALSGGVDSMNMVAALRRIFPKKQIIGVYIDSGLMPSETQEEVEKFCKEQDINLIVNNSSKLFFNKLLGITNPSEKGKVIGCLFIEEFEKIAKQMHANFFAQGTIWSDVVESGVTKFSSQIKPHHNVACLPKKMNFHLLEPFREIFKNQVRELADFMNLPKNIVNKKVFPGPGFAIRIEGEATPQKVKLVRECTRIIEDIIFNSKIKKDIWMAFAILINSLSLGVKGDKRVENKNAIVVRIVESKNSMTANFSQKAFPYLEKISDRIIRETQIGRVVYDITNKPPATIEWQ